MSELHSYTQSTAASHISTNTRTANEFEQQVWLHHEQCGDSTHQYVSAFRLNGEVDLARLMKALEAMLDSLPDINSRYRLNEDFELVKEPGPQRSARVELMRFSERREAVQQLLTWQDQRIDLAHQSPLACRLMIGEDVILALRHHRIVAQCLNWQVLFSSLSGFYHGELNIEDWIQSQPGGTPVAHPFYQTQQPLNSNHHWLAAGQTSLRYPLEHLGQDRLKTVARRAETVRVTVPFNLLTRCVAGKEEANSLEHAAMLCAAMSAFGRFLARLNGQTECTVFAPSDIHQRHQELNGRAVQSDLVQITIDTRLSEINAYQSVKSAWQTPTGVARPPADAGELATLVTWSVDPARQLRLSQVQSETIRIPPLHSDFDLVLALGVGCDNKLLLELTSGARLSSYTGARLLEHFVDYLHGNQSCVTFPARLADGNVEAVTEQLPELLDTADNTSADNTTQRERMAYLIRDAFAEALKVTQFGIHDDFFDFGGHSLVATRVIGQLKAERQIEIHINDLFSQPTAWGLAEHAVDHGENPSHLAATDLPHSTLTSHSRSAPLSFAQASLWKAYAAFGYNELFNIPFALRFVDPVDEQVFGQAFADLLHRHSALRSLFRTDGDQVVQTVIEVGALEHYRWFWPSSESVGMDRQAVLNQEAGYVFDLSKELPIRVRFVRDTQSGAQYLSLLVHHIVLDEWSVNLLIDDLKLAYAARSAGHGPQWPSEVLPLTEYALKQARQGANSEHLGYWLEQLRDAPFDTPLLPALQDDVHCASDAGGWVEISLEPNVISGLYGLAKQQGASLFNVVYAAIAMTLKHLGAPDKLVVGTPASGRLDSEFYDTVGYFTTLAMHLVHFDQADTVGELVAQVKNTINQSLPYSDVPIDWVEDALAGTRQDKHHLFEVMIQLHAKNKLHGELTADGNLVRFEQVDPEKSESALGLQFEVMEERVAGQDSLRILMSYRSDVYGPQQVRQLTAVTQFMLHQFARPEAAGLGLNLLLTKQEQV